MARSITEIQQGMIEALTAKYDGLSTSKVAEWRLLLYIVAAAVHSFEVILDLFRTEVDVLTTKITAGTVAWYAEMARRFQYGHTLEYDNLTAMYYYPEEDEAARIVKVVAIVEGDKSLVIKVGKLDDEGRIVPLDGDEADSFKDYIRVISIAGIHPGVVSTTADRIRYELEVIYDPIITARVVEENIRAALEEFKLAITFNAMFYPSRLIEAVMGAEGVVTASPRVIEHRSTEHVEYTPVGVYVELDAGYFEYADAEENAITLKSTKEL